MNWWLTTKYSRLDLIWLVWAVLAWRDHHYFAMFAVIAVGAILSGILEAWNEDREPTP
jgi:hypothetical protein